LSLGKSNNNYKYYACANIKNLFNDRKKIPKKKKTCCGSLLSSLPGLFHAKTNSLNESMHHKKIECVNTSNNYIGTNINEMLTVYLFNMLHTIKSAKFPFYVVEVQSFDRLSSSSEQNVKTETKNALQALLLTNK
jgi:hypothetical protein